MATKTVIAAVCLEPELAKIIDMVVDVQGTTVSRFFWSLARNEVVRMGLMENPATKYMPPAAPVDPETTNATADSL